MKTSVDFESRLVLGSEPVKLQGNQGFVYASLAGDIQAQVVAASRSVATIVVQPNGEQANLSFTVGDGAGVHVIFPALPQLTHVTIEVAAGAHLTVSFVGELTKQHTLTALVRLVGDGANAHVQMALVGARKSEAELACTIEHAARATFARMLVRRVHTGSSFSMLRGMLKVAKEGHGTDTYLSDKALLLGEKARAESVPGLEILADDVKASHGATIGRLSAEELFYLRSRGLPEAEATRLLARAFLEPALVGVPPEVVLGLEHILTTYAAPQLT